MGNLVFGSAERPGNSADAAEISVVRDNDVAIGQGARPTERPEKASAAARHNGAQRGAFAENVGGDDRAENLPKHDSVNVLLPETPDGAIRLAKPLFGVVPKTPVMTHLFASPDSAYVSRHVYPDDTELKLPAVTENAEWIPAPKRKERRSVWTSGSSPEACRHSQKERETELGIDDNMQKAEDVSSHRISQSAESNRSMQEVQRKPSGEGSEADKSRRNLTEERYRDNRRHVKVDGRSRRPPTIYSAKEDTEPK